MHSGLELQEGMAGFAPKLRNLVEKNHEDGGHPSEKLSVFRLFGCRFKAKCPSVRPGPIGAVPSMKVVLRDPRPYLRKFWRKPQKTPNSCFLEIFVFMK